MRYFRLCSLAFAFGLLVPTADATPCADITVDLVLHELTESTRALYEQEADTYFHRSGAALLATDLPTARDYHAARFGAYRILTDLPAARQSLKTQFREARARGVDVDFGRFFDLAHATLTTGLMLRPSIARQPFAPADVDAMLARVVDTLAR